MTPRRSGATPDDAPYRAGFACFVGRPNAGKSTLTNAIVGQKIAITSNKPQTTRHVIRGVLHRPDAQLVLVDTPGLHRPRTLLGERLNDLVRPTWSEVDVIGLCIPADEPVGRGDRFITGEMAELKATVLAVVTKTDLVDKQQLAEQLLAVSELGDFADVVPVSAVSGAPGRHAGRRDDRLPAAVAAALPGRHAHRRAGAGAGRRADPGGGPGGGPRRAAALDRGGGRGDDPRGPAHEDLRRRLRRAAQPEGDRDRRTGPAGSRRSAPAPASRSRSCSAPGSTSTCTCGWPRTGSATRSSCASSASDPRRLGGPDPAVAIRIVGGGQGLWRSVHVRPRPLCRLVRDVARVGDVAPPPPT